MTDSPLPLDRYPQIVFSGRSVTPAVVTLRAEETSVTTATVTLSAAPTCIMCGEALGRHRWDRRSDIKTCSPRCRKAASRRTASINREVQHVQAALGNLERFSDKWPDLFQDVMRAIGQCGIAATSTSRRVAPKGDNR